MGKSRGGKYHSKGRGPRKGPAEEDASDEEEFEPQQRGIGRQRANVGMLPPSDSDDEEGIKPASKAEEGKQPASKGEEGKEPASKGEPSSSQPCAQKKSAGKVPASDDDDDGDSSSSADDPNPEYLRAAPTTRKKQAEVEPRSEEQVRKELERLELIRKKREEDRLKRVRDEGWDRYAPISDTNKPPGLVPSDHPSNKD